MSTLSLSSRSPMPATEIGRTAPDLIVAAPAETHAGASTTTVELESRADEYVKQAKFNRRFMLPATDSHGELTITYAVAGLESDDAPTLVFIGGLYGGRFQASTADYLGSKLGMRVVVMDRPGMGGSTPVEPSLRLAVWLEMVPALMTVLNVRHVSLAAHSCGAIYALNTVHAMPWILPPSNRKLYLFAPWVAPDHSGMALLSFSSHLPSQLITGFDSIVRFVNTTIVPTVHFSGMLSHVVSAPFASVFGGDRTDSGRRVDKHERDDLCREYCGVSADEYAARTKALMHAIFSESTSAANHEALLTLRKEVAGPWGACDNYETYPDALEAKLQEYFEQTSLNEPTTQHKLILKTFWAETDFMIGKQGPEYFDKCFQRFAHDGQMSSGEHQDCLSYESELVSESNHDTICLPHYGALARMLEEVMEATRQ